jgi:hypothetical protein
MENLGYIFIVILLVILFDEMKNANKENSWIDKTKKIVEEKKKNTYEDEITSYVDIYDHFEDQISDRTTFELSFSFDGDNVHEDIGKAVIMFVKELNKIPMKKSNLHTLIREK